MDEKENTLNTLQPQTPDPIVGLHQENTFKTLGPKPQKVRRVGTVTLGLSLVTIGGLMIANMLIPGFPIYNIIRFSPVILVFIGIEILLGSFFNKGDRIRYDFLSMFISFFLIVGSFALSMAPNIYRNTVVRRQLQNSATAAMEEDVYKALEGEGISSLDAYFYLEDYLENGAELSASTPYSQLKGLVNYGSLNLWLDETMEDKAAFAKKAREILDKLEPLDLPLQSFSIDLEDGQANLVLDSHWQWSLSAEELEKRIQWGDETGDARYDAGYSDGYDEGYGQGLSDGYDEGYTDGEDSLDRTRWEDEEEAERPEEHIVRPEENTEQP